MKLLDCLLSEPAEAREKNFSGNIVTCVTSVPEKAKTEGEPGPPEVQKLQKLRQNPKSFKTDDLFAAFAWNPEVNPLGYPDPEDRPAQADWNERHFGRGKVSRLMPYIGQRVSTPDGTGVLLAVHDRCHVDLGDVDQYGERKCRFYKLADVEPIQ